MSADGRWADLELVDHLARGAAPSAALLDRIDGRLVPTPALSQVLHRLRTMAEEATLSIATLRRTQADLSI